MLKKADMLNTVMWSITVVEDRSALDCPKPPLARAPH
jgi:hypothetical protein